MVASFNIPYTISYINSRISPEIKKYFPLELFPKLWTLKIRHGTSIVAACYQLSSKRWTPRAWGPSSVELSWQYLRRSTERPVLSTARCAWYYGWINMYLSIKLINRYDYRYPARYLLCSSTLSLGLSTKHRSCFRNFCLYIILISLLYRDGPKRAINKNSFYFYIYWSKHNFFPQLARVNLRELILVLPREHRMSRMTVT